MVAEPPLAAGLKGVVPAVVADGDDLVAVEAHAGRAHELVDVHHLPHQRAAGADDVGAVGAVERLALPRQIGQQGLQPQGVHREVAVVAGAPFAVVDKAAGVQPPGHPLPPVRRLAALGQEEIQQGGVHIGRRRRVVGRAHPQLPGGRRRGGQQVEGGLRVGPAAAGADLPDVVMADKAQPLQAGGAVGHRHGPGLAGLHREGGGDGVAQPLFRRDVPQLEFPRPGRLCRGGQLHPHAHRGAGQTAGHQHGAAFGQGPVHRGGLVHPALMKVDAALFRAAPVAPANAQQREVGGLLFVVRALALPLLQGGGHPAQHHRRRGHRAGDGVLLHKGHRRAEEAVGGGLGGGRRRRRALEDDSCPLRAPIGEQRLQLRGSPRRGGGALAANVLARPLKIPPHHLRRVGGAGRAVGGGGGQPRQAAAEQLRAPLHLFQAPAVQVAHGLPLGGDGLGQADADPNGGGPGGDVGGEAEPAAADPGQGHPVHALRRAVPVQQQQADQARRVEEGRVVGVGRDLLRREGAVKLGGVGQIALEGTAELRCVPLRRARQQTGAPARAGEGPAAGGRPVQIEAGPGAVKHHRRVLPQLGQQGL